MSRTASRVPAYRLHKASGQAVVTLGGKDHYLGPHATPESRQAYDRLTASWLTAGRPKSKGNRWSSNEAITVAELVLAYWKDCDQRISSSAAAKSVRPPLRRLNRLFGAIPANDFGPRDVKAYQAALAAEVRATPSGDCVPRLSRRYINISVKRIRACFKWGVAEELVDPSVLLGLQAVRSIRYGHHGTRETKPVTAVADAVIDRTLPHLPGVLSDMVRVHRLTGMRPGELCAMSLRDIDMADEVWIYRPRKHKTAAHGCA